MAAKKISAFTVLVLTCSACNPVPYPDKSVAGGVLGAAWGAGAGAVVGNQTGNTAHGAGLGSAFGAGAGILTGIGLDIAEGQELSQQRTLDALHVQVAGNQREIVALQDQLDNRTRHLVMFQNSTEVRFDTNSAALSEGSVSMLQHFANNIKMNPWVGRIEIHGHSDDLGDKLQNARLSEQRSRTVATFLAAQGIPLDQMKLYAHAANRPLVSNETEAGKQLNRRVEILLVK